MLCIVSDCCIIDVVNVCYARPQAKLVASATGNLCEAANSVVQGQAQEEKLIAAAKAVASSTAQLLIACQVKADTRSENNRRLQVSPYRCTVYNRQCKPLIMLYIEQSKNSK